MASDPRVRQLLEEVLDSGRTPEDVCGACPDLLPLLQQAMKQLSHVEAEVDALFDEPKATLLSPNRVEPAPAGLPRIPGYEVQSVLGRGGMGVVYKAHHVRLNRPVALKMLLTGAYAGPEERERFMREAEAVAGLRHPNIVQVYDFGDIYGRQFFTMEFVEGGSLAQKLAGTPQPSRHAAELVATLAGAIHVAHHGRIVHRDLKPANILLTSDGTPKITDFGLAKRLETDSGTACAGITQSGQVMGTLSYMSPEQALGKARTLGCGVDIYALGAILYEMLTGRPPFRAETVTETIQLVVAAEPVPPTQFNPKVSRDLQTICLKCLQKEASRRYADADALAKDLRRFLNGESISARPTGIVERTGKWVRRHPALSATFAASAILATVLLCGGMWLWFEQRAIEHAVDDDLREVIQFQNRSAWTEASAALARAKGHLGERPASDLRRRLDQATENQHLAMRLEAISLEHVDGAENAEGAPKADADYEAEFHSAGYGDILRDTPAIVAARVNASTIRQALTMALDDWTCCLADRGRVKWIHDVLKIADPDPTGWRDQVRDWDTITDHRHLAELARSADVEKQAVPLLQVVAVRLRATGGDAIPLLKRIQQAHPADFWANFTLGDQFKRNQQWSESIGYFRAAIAIRPDATIAWSNLSIALLNLRRVDEAIELQRVAVRISPASLPAQFNLGLCYYTAKRYDEALAQFKIALRLKPDEARVHVMIGDCLSASGRLPEADIAYRDAFALNPNRVALENGVRMSLLRQGRAEELRAAWRKAISANGKDHGAWNGYAELCLFSGHDDVYRNVRANLLKAFGDTADPHVAERVCRACLLLPPSSEDELGEAVALIDRALAADRSNPNWGHSYFLFAKALAEYRSGHFESAVTLLKGDAAKVLGPAPGLVLALAQNGLGKKDDARRTLATALLAFDWNPSKAESPEIWIYHILRREAEARVLPE